MFYGFVDEDLRSVNKNDPLFLQAEYAKIIGKFCLLNLDKRTIDRECVNEGDEKLLLRTTCENYDLATKVLESLNINLVETKYDVEYIENWFQLELTKRNIRKMTLEDMTNPDGKYWIKKNLANQPCVFIKSLVKGFSCVMPKDGLLNNDEELMRFLSEQCSLWGSELIVSEFLNVKRDSLGNRETRHVIFNNKVVNSSRQIKYLVHNVPKSHVMKAYEIVDRLCKVKDFPQNYVLDVCEFIDENEQVYIDIVEINPLSTSMCYLNNSIFHVGESDEKSLFTYNMGIEFYNDYLVNPERYHLKRKSNGQYSYTTETHYDFR